LEMVEPLVSLTKSRLEQEEIHRDRLRVNAFTESPS